MKFVAATDGSDSSERAVDHAIELALAADASLTLVHAVEPSVYSEGGVQPPEGFSDADRRLVAEDVDDAGERGERILENARDRAADRGVTVDTELLYGDPEKEIPAFADADGFDGIFVGHRGLSGRAEEVMGSVAKGIVGRAPVPVTVVSSRE